VLQLHFSKSSIAPSGIRTAATSCKELYFFLVSRDNTFSYIISNRCINLGGFTTLSKTKCCGSYSLRDNSKVKPLMSKNNAG